MLWLSFLRRFWPYIAGALLVIGAFAWYHGQIHEAEKRGETKARIAFERQLEDEQEKWRQHQNEVNEEIDREYYQEKSALQRRVRRLLAGGDAIRMCKPSGGVSDAAGAVSGDDAGNAGGSTYSAGPDLRARLVEYGAGCEALRQQLSSWQAWYQALSAAK